MKLYKAALLLTLALFTQALPGLEGSSSTSSTTSSNSSKKRALKKKKGGKTKYFNRISNFFICDQIGENPGSSSSSCLDDDFETVAEIAAASNDGMTIVYTNSAQSNIGFVDITNPATPVPLGITELAGEPTSVAIYGKYAAVGVNTSPNFIDTKGRLDIVDVTTREIVRTIWLGGQPDSVAFSPDGNYIVVAIENRRDEDLGEGIPPQMPAGFVVVVDSSKKGKPQKWKKSIIDITNLSGVATFPEDPEPEYVAINKDNVAVITLQENNAIVLIDLPTLTVTTSFSAGTVDLENIDTEEEGVIDQSSSLTNVPREPDGVTWIDNEFFATADEGDMDGGSRGFTIFDKSGNVVYGSGSDLDQIAAAFGHYPDERSGNKGVEPENIAYGTFDDDKDILIVNLERANLSVVYDVRKIDAPKFVQVLPTSVAPEGLFTIPSRNLLIVACEKDKREDGFRSTLSIFEYGYDKPAYPTIRSWRDKDNGVAIPWSAISGLSPGEDRHTLYAVEDSFYNRSRIFTINTKKHPAIVRDAVNIIDSNDVFANAPITDDEFTADDLAVMINDDGTVNLDLEGIAMDDDGNFYVVSEGKGTKGGGDDEVSKINLIFHVTKEGVIAKVITLPNDVASKMLKYGLQGIAYYNNHFVVAIQQAFQDMVHPLILCYNIEDGEWEGRVQYPLDDVESPAGGWVGIADITHKGNGIFYVLERDNQGGLDAAVKKVYSFDLMEYSGENEIIEKTLVTDLLPTLKETTQGLVPEKIEGLASTSKGLFLINDNDGVDDNSGETNLWNLGML